MPTQSLTLNIPSTLYDNLKQRAEQAQRSVEEGTLEVLATAVPTEGELPAELSEAVESLQGLDDAALWDVVQRGLPAEVSHQLEELHWQRQRQVL